MLPRPSGGPERGFPVSVSAHDRLYVATSVADAVAALADRADAGAPLAGATWIMRAPIRGERDDLCYVAIGEIEELRAIDISDGEVGIGACATHAQLVASLGGLPEFCGLVHAARGAANPAVREIATIGGNLCATKFPASDLAPALLSMNAEVELRRTNGVERLALGRFLDMRADLEPGALLSRIVVARGPVRSAHARLPLRKAGDYPVAIVSVAAARGASGSLEDLRIAVGSVEPAARRWEELETALAGRPLDPVRAFEAARVHSGAFAGRDSVEAPGWYRVQVLPSLVRSAFEALRHA